MNPHARHPRWLWAHESGVSGSKARGVFADKNPALHRPRTASTSLTCLLPTSSQGAPVMMSLAFQLRNNSNLRGCSGSPMFCGNGDDAFDNICRDVREAVADTLVEVRDAVGLKKTDVLWLRKRNTPVEVPSGNPVSERAWAKLDAGRKVSFSPRIAAVLIPTRGEIYPTATHKAACFLSSDEAAKEAKDASRGGKGHEEWRALLAETRREAKADREKRVQARLHEQRLKKEEPVPGKDGTFDLFGAFGRFWQAFTTSISGSTSNDDEDDDNNGERRVAGGGRAQGILGDGGTDHDMSEKESPRQTTRKHLNPLSCPSKVGIESKGREAG